MKALIEATSNQGTIMTTYRRWKGKKILTMGRGYGD